MPILDEIKEVVEDYLESGKSVKRIVVNTQLLSESLSKNSVTHFDRGTEKFMGVPMHYTENPYHRFTVETGK